jgi:PAS domain S-box-containing protein
MSTIVVDAEAVDWSATPLGPRGDWPAALTSIFEMMLASPLAMCVSWGPEQTFLYNAAYAPFLGERHPSALGQPFQEIWADVWADIGPLVDQVMAGGSVSHVDMHLVMTRNGHDEDTWWTFAYSPLLDDGQVVGLINIATETTAGVIASRQRDVAEAELHTRNAELEREVVARTEARDRFATLIEHLPVGVSLLDREGRAILANPVFRRFLPDEPLPSRMEKPQEASRWCAFDEGGEQLSPDRYPAARALRGELVVPGIEFLHRMEDGQEVWLSVSGVPVTDSSGQITGVIVMVDDIDVRKRALETAHANAERVQLALAAGAIIGTWVWDIPSDRFTVDEAFATSFGFDPALGRAGLRLAQVVETVHPDDQAGLAEAINEAIARGGAYAHQYRVRRQDGRYYWLEANGHVEQDADGSPLTFPGVLIDVEERRALADERDRALAELRHINETLEQRVAERTGERDRAWRLSQELRVTALPDGTLEAVNPVWTDLLGWTEQELIGSQFTSYTHPDDLERTEQVFASIFERPLSRPYEYRFRHKDDSYRWFGWTAAFEDGKVYAAGRDTTVERGQAAALLQAQKMEAVGQLTGGLAHDFNNLLAGISGSLELIGYRIEQGRMTDVEKYVVAAQGAAKRAAALTHRLLAFSRRQTLAPKATSVNAMVSDMLDLIRRTVGPSVDLTATLTPDLWPALVDQSQLENALLNLCINARDAMPGGGRVVIETMNRRIDHRTGKQLDLPEGDYLSLSVSDTGTGMPPEIIARVFEPFFTTKPIGQGTGLGLSMIYGFAKQSGGQARIHSQPGEGTTVSIYLPRYHTDADRVEVVQDAEPLPAAEQGETILVVDDEATIRMLVADILGDLGYTVIEAADGAGGLKVLQSNAQVDLLITDVGLPGGMNGRQVADAARATRPGLRVLFITGFAETTLLSDGQLEPGMSILTKPFPVDALAARIREMLSEDV